MGTGNTSITQNNIPRSSVHPRGHGEHFRWWRNNTLYHGSSPWARGTPVHIVYAFLLVRFIPVGTGNTYGLAPFLYYSTVHPRGHGEHIKRENECSGFSGSSPWARGTHPEGIPAMLLARFIPVGTGNTSIS